MRGERRVDDGLGFAQLACSLNPPAKPIFESASIDRAEEIVLPSAGGIT